MRIVASQVGTRFNITPIYANGRRAQETLPLRLPVNDIHAADIRADARLVGHTSNQSDCRRSMRTTLERHHLYQHVPSLSVLALPSRM